MAIILASDGDLADVPPGWRRRAERGDVKRRAADPPRFGRMNLFFRLPSLTGAAVSSGEH